jgi:hypothetical protein
MEGANRDGEGKGDGMIDTADITIGAILNLAIRGETTEMQITEARDGLVVFRKVTASMKARGRWQLPLDFVKEVATLAPKDRHWDLGIRRCATCRTWSTEVTKITRRCRRCNAANTRTCEAKRPKKISRRATEETRQRMSESALRLWDRRGRKL